MAIRVTPILLNSFRRSFIRSLSSTPSSLPVFPLNFDEKPKHEHEHEHERETLVAKAQPQSSSILDLDDTQKLFSSFSTKKLLKSSITLHCAAIDRVVDLGIWVTRSKLMETPVFRDIVLETVKRSFFEQFVAGRDLEETGRTIRFISDAGLRAMINYGLEHAHDNVSCDHNFKAVLNTIEYNKNFPSSSVSFVIVKISSICPVGLLGRISDLLRWEKQNPLFNLPWKQNTLPIFSSSSPLYHTLQEPNPLTPQEEKDLELAQERLAKLCQRCLELNVPLTVDAEDTKVQPAIDYLTYKSSIEFNKFRSNGPIICGTIQAYLKDARERMLLATKEAEKMGLPLGFKLVRGAYMSSETKLAQSLGFESPIHDSIQDTHNCYNDCASFMLDKVADGFGAVVLATHNIESGRIAATKARSLGIGRENDRFQFAQLYGMSDVLSYGLKNAGFQVSKYLTFGPVEDVIPYLLRRAEENRGMLCSSNIDRTLMGMELKRRLKASINV